MRKLLLGLGLVALLAALAVAGLLGSGIITGSSVRMVLNVMTGLGGRPADDAVVDQRYRVPAGFNVQLYAADLPRARFLRFTPASSGTRTIRVTTSNANPDSDPDFLVWRAGTLMLAAESADFQIEEDSFSAVAGTTYVIDVYDCANGCFGQGTPGDYTLTISIQ